MMRLLEVQARFEGGVQEVFKRLQMSKEYPQAVDMR
jgi:hypothetical protein